MSKEYEKKRKVYKTAFFVFLVWSIIGFASLILSGVYYKTHLFTVPDTLLEWTAFNIIEHAEYLFGVPMLGVLITVVYLAAMSDAKKLLRGA